MTEEPEVLFEPQKCDKIQFEVPVEYDRTDAIFRALEDGTYWVSGNLVYAKKGDIIARVSIRKKIDSCG